MARPRRLETLKRRNRKLRRLLYENEMREQKRIDSIPEVGEEWGPGVDGLPTDIQYSDRGPRDVVLSGPLGKKVDGSKSPGRWFATGYDAFCWAEAKYGANRVTLILEEGARWAILVKNLRI